MPTGGSGGADDVARYNVARWAALARAGAVFTRPWLDVDAAEARARLDPDGRLGELTGKDVLCLASGGGQHAVAFALLGARVTSVDLSPEQVERDRDAARHHGVALDAHVGDMRDLSHFAPGSFDLVWQPYSLNFAPDAAPVIRGVRRVLRTGGWYVVMCANPFTAGVGTADWDGAGYRLWRPYVAGAEMGVRDEAWVADRAGGGVPPAREYRHTLGDLVAALVAAGFAIEAVEEYTHATPAAEPGSWEHLTSVAPPWLTWWCRAAAG
jgi:SAM-dependent methyltransferase